jgi:hypothetical protein
MRVERSKLEGKNFDPSTFKAGGVNHFEKVAQNSQKSIDFKIAQGWDAEDSKAYSVLIQGVSASLAKSISDASPRYAASAHLCCSVLAKQAEKLAKSGAVSEDCYYHLRGQFGLADEDKNFATLERPDCGRGTSFQTAGVTIAHARPESLTADGFCVALNTGGKTSCASHPPPRARTARAPPQPRRTRHAAAAQPTAPCDRAAQARPAKECRVQVHQPEARPGRAPHDDPSERHAGLRARADGDGHGRVDPRGGQVDRIRQDDKPEVLHAGRLLQVKVPAGRAKATPTAVASSVRTH